MSLEALLFMLALIVVAILLFATVFFIFMYEDLKSDYINPMDFCNRLNQFVLPEMFGHAALTLTFLLGMSVIAFLINVPLLAYNIWKVLGNKHMFDATNIILTINKYEREAFVKLAFYLLCFFYYLYRMILGLIEG